LFLRPLPAVILAVCTTVACGGSDLLLPKDGDPAHIVILNGNDQRDTVGRPLTDSFVVKVTDTEDRPVPNIEVVFSAPAGAQVLPNDTMRTGSNGQAAVAYTLSTTAGEQLVEARATPIVPATSASATFKATALPEPAQTLLAAGGNEQNAQVETVLPESLAVRAVDRFGNGVPGVEVTWEAQGGGQVSPEAVTTSADGLAKTARTLGERPGAYGSAARAADLEGSPVAFTAMGTPAPKPELVLVTQPSTDAEAGVPLQQQPEIQLQDPLGAPLLREDVSVTVQIAGGSGSLAGKTTVKSDGNGRVRFTDLELRGETGSRTLIFAAEGFIPTTSATITVTAGPPSADQSSVSVPNGTAGVSTTIAIQLKDEFENPVSGAGGRLSIEVAGANSAGDLPVNENGNGSYSASYVPIHTGSDLVGVRVNGEAVQGSPFTSTVAAGPADPTTTTVVLTRTGFFGTTVNSTITVRDAQGNPLGRGGDQVQVQLNGGAPQDAADNGDGTYSRADFIGFGSVSVTVFLNGVPVSGSPFTI
jgi:filamin/ABP280 repeat protein/Big-like domain-containing protein